eukprot:TRINITY_DN4678_c0_g1_i3.p1 TRINITY_DN4678_c0_g1~~TRINITY_DN4678_c0_g1_i3.p1  ORF type:complete len:566 (-),score=102.88 TRINITY_DN4678_c0_g1_i3:835-2532(-)
MADQGSGSSAADSYIGSLISLTSKSEIRYEGVLYTVDTENSNIALQNVRSYGTEGRKKDGPQIPASEKVYDYIVFRGKDIKDLQVKSGPAATAVAAPPAPPVDPAIVSMPAPSTTGDVYPPPRRLPTAADTPSASMLYAGAPPPSIQQGAGPPAYQGTGWGPSPTSAAPNGVNVSMPQQWQGYYRGTSAHDSAQHGQAASRPLHPPQQLLTPPNLMASAGFPSQQQVTPAFLPPEVPVLNTSGTVSSAFSHHTINAPLTAVVTPAAKGPRRLPVQTPCPAVSAPVQSNVQQESSASVAPTFRQEAKPREVVEMQGTSQPVLGHPLLPLPTTPPQKQGQGIQGGYRGGGRPASSGWPGGNVLQPAGNRRGGGRGMRMGGRGIVQPTGQTQQFTEDFDFTAMNEKFKKEEVWGELGGGPTKAEEKEDEASVTGETEEERNADENADGSLSATSGEAPAQAKKSSPVYDKDDFFDTISCDSLDREHGGQRSRFSEQRKVDIETFGQAQMRSGRGGRGGRGGRRGGGGYRGGYGYGGYGGLGKQAPHHYGMHRSMEQSRGRGGGLPHNL